jgi:hypothetical protein
MGKWISHRSVRDVDWDVWQQDNGRYGHDAVERAILLDIRAELKALNQKMSILQCPDFQAIPRLLKAIRTNTAKRRRRKAPP